MTDDTRELVEALRIAEHYVRQAVDRDGGLDACEISYRADYERVGAALAKYTLSECLSRIDPNETDEREAAAQALAFAQPKLIALKNEKGLVGVWCQAFRVGWGAANRVLTKRGGGHD